MRKLNGFELCGTIGRFSPPGTENFSPRGNKIRSIVLFTELHSLRHTAKDEIKSYIELQDLSRDTMNVVLVLTVAFRCLPNRPPNYF